MKKNKIIFIITVILAAVAAYFLLTQKKTTIKEALQDFAVSDTASITKIFIADKQGKTVTLIRQPNKKWSVNNKFYAFPGIINTLLETIKNVRVRTRVGKMEFNSVIGGMAASAVKCEIYTKDPDKAAKVYFVGYETQDLLGTYMLLEGSSTPFVMELPGFNGFLNSRYFTDEQDWREHTIYDYKPSDISSITITYPPDPEKSFKIEWEGKFWKVSSPVTGQVLATPDTTALENYVDFYSFINFEGFDVEFSQHQRDSLIALGPLTTITVRDKTGRESSVKIYPKPINKRSLAQADAGGVPLKYDVDRMYALVKSRAIPQNTKDSSTGEDFVVIQHYVFDKLLKQLNDFDVSTKKKPNK